MSTTTDAFTLRGQTALVTGATQGIGRATVTAFLTLGARVLAVARTAADLRLRADGEWAALGGEVHTCASDLATEAGRAAAVAAVGTCFGGSLDVLVNNVGTNIRRPVDAYTVADLRALMAVNVESAFALSLALGDALARAAAASRVGERRRAGGASVVNVSSVSSLSVVRASTVGYAMTKGALDQLTRWLAVSWAERGVRVNGVHPWYIRTPLTESVLQDADRRARIEAATPAGRVGEVEEVAQAIAFLAMPAAAYITGVQLPVDGGYLALGGGA